MSNLFKKAACFTDLHLGLKSNSVTHNQDCEDFVDWFIATAKAEGCETGIFLGDYHHNRNNINMLTMSFSIRCLEKLGRAFDQFYFFPGNHDLYYKDKRDVHSVDWGRHIPGVTIVNEITSIDGVTLVPWMIGDEWKKIDKLKSQYIFGHFELPLFYMNAMVQMPDHGELQLAHLKSPEYVFSGHFHKRQAQQNVVYIGNAFPHNYADAWDDDRGMMTLEWGGTPQFHVWQDAPKFKVIKLSQLLDDADTLIKSKTFLRVNIDIDISFEEASFIKETYMNQYHIRELTLIPQKKLIEVDSNPEAEIFESIDQIVSDQLLNIQSESYDPNILLKIYNNL
jgi:DNA repair exonuclease SbcCD nuclease subunit